MIAWYLPVLSVYLQQNAIVYLTCECNIESKTRKKILGLPLIISGRFREEKKLQIKSSPPKSVSSSSPSLCEEYLVWSNWYGQRDNTSNHDTIRLACKKMTRTAWLHDQSEQQHAKKVVCDSLGLVDFAIALVNSVLNLPTIGKWVFWVNSNYRSRTVINPAHQIFSG